MTTDPDKWLEELFEFDYCEECGGDAEDHEAISFLGCWFASCKHPIPDSIDVDVEKELKDRIARKDAGLPLIN